MSNPGLITSHAFEYQKLVYFHYIISSFNVYNDFIYEGEDDIECNSLLDHSIYIQAKTGIISEDKKINIIYNWLRVSNWNNATYCLILSQEQLVDIDEMILKAKDNIIINGEKSNIRSNLYKAYSSCQNCGSFSIEILEDRLKSIKKNFRKRLLPSEEIYSQLSKNYSDSFVSNENVLESQIIRRLDFLAERVLKKINDTLAPSYEYSVVIKRPEFNEWNYEAVEKYNLNNFNARKSRINKNFAIDEGLREVIQMRYANLEDDEILDNLINKVLYEDFKDFYISSCYSEEIEGIESKAFYNYKNKKKYLKIKSELTSEMLFYEVTNTIINDVLITKMSDAQFCRIGCYIYLSSDSVEEEKQISWEVKDE